MADTSKLQDQLLRKVFAIALEHKNTDAAANPPVICLQGLAEVRPFLLFYTTHCDVSCECESQQDSLVVGITLDFATQEFQSEARPLQLGKDTVDRAIMARLLDAPEDYPQWPLTYLVGCYARAIQEARSLSSIKDKEAANQLQQLLQYCKDLITSNAGLLLTMSDSLFPQVWSPAPAGTAPA